MIELKNQYLKWFLIILAIGITIWLINNQTNWLSKWPKEIDTSEKETEVEV